MIKHHPSFELLQAHVQGELPASISAGIAIHSEMCACCANTISQLTEQMAEAYFEQDIESGFQNTESDLGFAEKVRQEQTVDFDDMIANITEDITIAEVIEPKHREIDFNAKQYQLPSVLSNMQIGKARHIGKLSRSRLQLDEDEIHTNLLHIEPGGGVPEHTHKGFELTVLLEGSFTDEQGEYVKGDFIMLDAQHTHHPVSEKGCLCYTVANDALHFTQGINKLLNPLGSFIY